MSTTNLYDTIDAVPEAERGAAKEAYQLAYRATILMRLDPSALHAASQAIEAHQRKTGWRYLPGGIYRHRTRQGTNAASGIGVSS